MKRQVWLFALGLGSAPLMAQDWEIDGNIGMNPISNYVGNNDNVDLNFRTDSLFRMRLWNTNNAVLNTFNVSRNGFLGVSQQPLFFTNGPGPFSRLHLVDSTSNSAIIYAQDFGYRPWMRNGVTMTGNADQMYIGHKYAFRDSMDYESGEVNDRSDAVIEWSDNPDDSPWGTDRLRFMFTNDYQVASPKTYGARSLEGMEAMRIYIPTDTTAHVGIGDFFRAGVLNGQNEDPTERLHVRDGRVRIQQLPDDAPADSDYVVMVVDTTALPNGERGVVKWVPASAILSATDCEWSMTGGSGAGVNDVWTAVGGQVDGCPDQTEAVGIGTDDPTSKLDIVTNNFAQGLHVDLFTANTQSVGAKIEATGGTLVTTGVATDVTGTGLDNVGQNTQVSGASGTNRGELIVVSGSADDNQGVALAVSGASDENVGSVSLISGGAQINTGDRVDVSDAVQENVGFEAVVDGDPVDNYGARLTVSGAPSDANVGALIDVSGSPAFNTGVSVGVQSATDTNVGVDVATTGSSSAWNIGLRSNQSGSTTRVRGLYATTTGASGSGSTGYGVHSVEASTSATYSHGVSGVSNGATTQSYGVSGFATGSATINCGLYGRGGATQMTPGAGRYGVWAGTSDTTGAQYAAWFNGKTYLNGVGTGSAGIFYTSDEALKTNIQPINSALESLSSLSPSTYDFILDAVPGMALPSGTQPGLMAQEVETVFPALVREFTFPATVDTLGNIIHPEVPYKAINYTGLIPYLIQAVKELGERNQEMSEMLNACCANMEGREQDGAAGSTLHNEVTETERLIIAPNPFDTRTTVHYFLPKAGRARLEVSNADGRAMKVLHEEETTAGQHTYDWNTSGLSAGTYFVALVVDDNVIVKRAVKVK